MLLLQSGIERWVNWSCLDIDNIDGQNQTGEDTWESIALGIEGILGQGKAGHLAAAAAAAAAAGLVVAVLAVHALGDVHVDHTHTQEPAHDGTEGDAWVGPGTAGVALGHVAVRAAPDKRLGPHDAAAPCSGRSWQRTGTAVVQQPVLQEHWTAEAYIQTVRSASCGRRARASRPQEQVEERWSSLNDAQSDR